MRVSKGDPKGCTLRVLRFDDASRRSLCSLLSMTETLVGMTGHCHPEERTQCASRRGDQKVARSACSVSMMLRDARFARSSA